RATGLAVARGAEHVERGLVLDRDVARHPGVVLRQPGPILVAHLIAMGLTGAPVPLTTFSGAAAYRKSYCPSAAQSAARSSSHAISVSVTPRLRISALWSGRTTPDTGSTVTSLAMVSVTRLGISMSWNHCTSSALCVRPGSTKLP